MPVRKRGHPTLQEAALLQRDLTPEMLAMKPGVWKGQQIRHADCLNGWVQDFRHKPDDGRVWWTVKFPDAPHEFRKKFEMDSEQLFNAIGLFKEFAKKQRVE